MNVKRMFDTPENKPVAIMSIFLSTRLTNRPAIKAQKIPVAATIEENIPPIVTETPKLSLKKVGAYSGVSAKMATSIVADIQAIADLFDRISLNPLTVILV